MSKVNLSFTGLWNASLNMSDRELVKRDYSWASELGVPLIDRYLRMNAVAPTNPPNVRSRRKFFSGNIWEYIAGLVLWQLGIIVADQREVWTEDGKIRVKGKLDYLVGGKPNYGAARDNISKMPFQPEMTARFMKVIDGFEEKYGDMEFNNTVHEIKSCSSYVIEMIGEGGCVIGHNLQIFHYLRGLNLPTGHIDYISKDDALMQEVVISNPDQELEARYYGNLAELEHYLSAGERPPAEPLILFERKFKKNFGVEYSSYLNLIYPEFKEPMDYSEAISGKIASWNRVLSRIKMINEGVTTKTGKAILLTDKNKIAVTEMMNENYDAFELAKKLRGKIEEDEE